MIRAIVPVGNMQSFISINAPLCIHVCTIDGDKCLLEFESLAGKQIIPENNHDSITDSHLLNDSQGHERVTIAPPEARETPSRAITGPGSTGTGSTSTGLDVKQQAEWIIRRMTGLDICDDLIRTFEALSPVHISHDRIGAVMRKRLANNIITYVAVPSCTASSSVGTTGGPSRVVGTASLILEPKFTHDGSLVGHIEDVAVHPNWQNTGIGTLLLQHVVNQAWSYNCRKIILGCQQGLCPFYERFGFARHGVLMRADRH